MITTHIKAAIEQLEETQSCAGCNDYTMDDTPENRALWDECQAWNLKMPVAEVKGHADYQPPCQRPGGRLDVSDSITVFALRKATGML